MDLTTDQIQLRKEFVKLENKSLENIPVETKRNKKNTERSIRNMKHKEKVIMYKQNLKKSKKRNQT